MKRQQQSGTWLENQSHRPSNGRNQQGNWRARFSKARLTRQPQRGKTIGRERWDIAVL
jgi:hypothetical protein